MAFFFYNAEHIMLQLQTFIGLDHVVSADSSVLKKLTSRNAYYPWPGSGSQSSDC